MAYSWCNEDNWRKAVWAVPDFTAPSHSVVILEPCELNCMGHCPKMFLYMLDEPLYVYKGLSNDFVGQQIITYEILFLQMQAFMPGEEHGPW